MRLFGGISAAVAALVVFVVPAFAQDVCTALRGQLAELDRQGGNTQQQYQALSNQYARARATYDQAYAQARQMGCMVLIQRFAPPQCGGVRQSLSAQEANLNNLQRALQVAGGGQATAVRNTVLAELARNNCSLQAPVEAPVRDTYRTICVRPGDGYWFPLSYSTTRTHFTADTLACRSQCEGATMFFHRNPGEDVDRAVTLNGERYAELPYAFAYRMGFDPSLACRPSPEILQAAIPGAVVVTTDPRKVTEQEGPVVPIPFPRPMPTEDPDTTANRAGGFTPGDTIVAERPAMAGLTTESGVRLIGPAFYYAR